MFRGQGLRFKGLKFTVEHLRCAECGSLMQILSKTLRPRTAIPDILLSTTKGDAQSCFIRRVFEGSFTNHSNTPHTQTTSKQAVDTNSPYHSYSFVFLLLFEGMVSHPMVLLHSKPSRRGVPGRGRMAHGLRNRRVQAKVSGSVST